jgi:lipoate-protein ligase A
MHVERISGPAAGLFTADLPALDELVAVSYELPRPTLVLGSSQRPETVVDQRALEAAGVDLVRRRSGGGAVLLEPRASTWIDVLLPRSDAHWSDDVVKAAFWLGDAWAHALRALGVDAQVHRGGLEKTRWGALVCFGAIGPGEVAVAGRKVVGISQRRTRAGARFQCLVHDEWRPEKLLTLLALDAGQRDMAVTDLRDVAGGPGMELDVLEAEFLGQLGRLAAR